jgi:hypothetical protein
MKQFTLRDVFAVVFGLSLTLGPAIAAPAVIGTVTTGGAFRLNGDTVMANGTLTEGALIETAGGSLSMQLSGGARLSLSANSRGRLYRDHILLEKGETRLENGVGFHLQALGLTIRPDRGSATGRIRLLASNRVGVAALTGSLQVWNARGMLVGNVAAGSTLAFAPQTPATAAVTHITGILMEQSGHFLLTDQVTHVTVEVTGPDLAAYVGQTVEVTGTLNAAATPVAGASQVIVATEVRPIAGRRRGAAPAGAGGAASGTAVGVTTIAIVGGVAAAAILGGLAANDLLPGQGGNAPVSR